MKKVVLIALAVLLFAATTFAGGPIRVIGKTGDAAVVVGAGYVRGFIVITDGTNAVTFVCYDNASAASGDKFFSALPITTSATDRIRTIKFGDRDVPYTNGVYCDVTTSGTVTYDFYGEAL